MQRAASSMIVAGAKGMNSVRFRRLLSQSLTEGSSGRYRMERLPSARVRLHPPREARDHVVLAEQPRDLELELVGPCVRHPLRVERGDDLRLGERGPDRRYRRPSGRCGPLAGRSRASGSTPSPRRSLVGHRRIHEDGVDAVDLVDPLVDQDVREDPARHAHVAQARLPDPVRDVAGGDVLAELLDARARSSRRKSAGSSLRSLRIAGSRNSPVTLVIVPSWYWMFRSKSSR